jgi:hypothetical protein
LFERNLKGAENEQMELNFYTDLYFESLKLFKFFGRCVSLGFKDCQDKANMLLDNSKVLKDAYKYDDNADEVNYIEAIIKLELDRGIAMLNQDNNNTELKKWKNKEDVEKWMYNYQSTAWIIVRGAWFFDFMGEVMRLIDAERTWTLKKVAATAYDS